MTNIAVYVGDNRVDGVTVQPNANTLCQTLASGTSAPADLACNAPVAGRYVAVQRTSATAALLYLCEVEVYSVPVPVPASVPSTTIVNLAYNKRAWQIASSPLTAGAEPWKATDGKKSTNFSACARVYAAEPWW